MASIEATPTFNLKAVVQETDLKPDTLRAWERRYGLPQPARTDGGHRLYSQRDIDTLKWLIARQEEGLSISRAVALWEQLREEGKDPFQEMGDDKNETDRAPLEVGDTLTELRESWIEACLAFDERRAEYVVSQAFAFYAPETVCVEVLQRGLAEIGMRWYEGEVTAQQEHFASALAMRRLESLLVMNPPPSRAGRILIACPPEEEHAFSPLLLTLFLRRRGWDVIYLGANVPLDRMEGTIARTQPDLVILSAQTLHTAATMVPLAKLVTDAGIPLAYGGLIFNRLPALRERIPGHFLGEYLSRAPAAVERLLNAPSITPAATPAPALYEDALRHFRATRPRIEIDVWRKADALDIPQQHLAGANQRLAQGIISALSLGDMGLLGSDLEWVEGLMDNFHYQFLEETLRQYLRLYYESAAQHMSEDGQIVIDWLARVSGGAGK